MSSRLSLGMSILRVDGLFIEGFTRVLSLELVPRTVGGVLPREFAIELLPENLILLSS